MRAGNLEARGVQDLNLARFQQATPDILYDTLTSCRSEEIDISATLAVSERWTAP